MQKSKAVIVKVSWRYATNPFYQAIKFPVLSGWKFYKLEDVCEHDLTESFKCNTGVMPTKPEGV